MANGWQAAVCDWDRAIEWYKQWPKLNDLVELIEKRTSVAIESGELCWIASINIENVAIGLNTKRIKMAYVWRHDKQEYTYVLLEALHPLVSEKDIIDMSLKFNEDYGEKIK